MSTMLSDLTCGLHGDLEASGIPSAADPADPNIFREAAMSMHHQPNAPCTCSSGRKYKKCCGGANSLKESSDLLAIRELVETAGWHKSQSRFTKSLSCIEKALERSHESQPADSQVILVLLYLQICAEQQARLAAGSPLRSSSNLESLGAQRVGTLGRPSVIKLPDQKICSRFWELLRKVKVPQARIPTCLHNIETMLDSFQNLFCNNT